MKTLLIFQDSGQIESSLRLLLILQQNKNYPFFFNQYFIILSALIFSTTMWSLYYVALMS